MTIKMTQQDVAEWIVDILVRELELKPGDEVPFQRLKERYRARKGDAGDIPVGLQYAGNQEWLTYDGAKDAWHLTDLGYEYAA
jgi:hypothetical protein